MHDHINVFENRDFVCIELFSDRFSFFDIIFGRKCKRRHIEFVFNRRTGERANYRDMPTRRELKKVLNAYEQYVLSINR